MSGKVSEALQALENAVSDLEIKLNGKLDRANRSQAELFGISEEEKKLNRTIASKLDSTIARLETILQEES